jgi:hypothetical protein
MKESRVSDLKTEKSELELEVLCTDSTALLVTASIWGMIPCMNIDRPENLNSEIWLSKSLELSLIEWMRMRVLGLSTSP